MDRDIKMVDLNGQYQKIKKEVDGAIQQVINTSGFINGSAVSEFSTALSVYSNVKHVIPCANGTDALQIAYMALELAPGDEVIMPTLNYIASAEAAALLKLKPVFVDVHADTFNINETLIEEKITSRTKAIVVVHLFGQMANMEVILELAKKYQLKVIEDNAQALGADYKFSNGETVKSGTIGHINTTSFFPSKNLGCFGDGGAMITNSSRLAERAGMISKHGQIVKYVYECIGCNSRLDTIQASILNVKLKYLDEYAQSRKKAASIYTELLKKETDLSTPVLSTFSTHVFHQYVIKLLGVNRQSIKNFLAKEGIPSMIYYPQPLHLQKTFDYLGNKKGEFPVAEKLCEEVLAIPIHTELLKGDQEYITSKLIEAIKL